MAFQVSQPTQFNYRLPSGEIIAATINPGQAATVDVAGVLSGKVASDVPREILDLARSQVGGKTQEQLAQEFNPLTGVQKRGAVDISKATPSTSPELQQPLGTMLKEFTTPSGEKVTTPQRIPQIQTPQQQTYTVQAGDNLSKIAQKLGIPISAISGYRSGNPNLIFPGEVLKVGQIGAQIPQMAQPSTSEQIREIEVSGEATGAPEAITPTVIPSEPDVFSKVGIPQDLTTTSIEDVISKISTAFNLPEIDQEMKELDDNFIDDVASVNDNPWISEGLKSKKISQLQNKYDQKKDALVNRLRLQQDIVGKAIDVYFKEKDFQQDLLFKQLDFRQKELEGFALSPGETRFEFNPETGQFEEVAAGAPKETKLDTSLTEVGGRRVLVDNQTGDIIRDLGKATSPIGELGLLPSILANPDLFTTLSQKTQEELIPQLTSLGIPIPKKLTGEQETQKKNAESGISALDTLQNLIDKNPNIMRIAPILRLGTENQIYNQAAREAADVITRLRTGAALNVNEQIFYANYIPGIFDTSDSAKFKMNTLRNFYNLFSQNPTETFPAIKKKLAQQLGVGEILVQDLQTGEFGGILEREYDPNRYFKLTP